MALICYQVFYFMHVGSYLPMSTTFSRTASQGSVNMNGRKRSGGCYPSVLNVAILFAMKYSVQALYDNTNVDDVKSRFP